MTQLASQVAQCDPVWSKVREEAVALAESEPILASFVHATVLNHERLEEVLSFHLAQKLSNQDVPAMLLRQVFDRAMQRDGEIAAASRADMAAVYDRDPACSGYLEPLLFFKGFHSLQAYRVAHWLWREGRRAMALHVQNRSAEVFGVDIHPAARIGRGIMIDHGTGVVIGETAVVENDVSMLQGVTLGGTGKETGDRHPKVRRGAMLGAGAKILGNIEIGECVRVGAGSVVLRDVPPRCTVAGVPAKIVGSAGCDQPARQMDQRFPEVPDATG